jgi:ribose transport system permease protein
MREDKAIQRWITQYGGLSIALLVLVVVFSLLSKNFASLATVATILNSSPDLILVAIGMTLVLIIGGIDLSVGSVMAFSAAVLAVVYLDWKLPLPVAFIAAILAGMVCGMVNGAISVGFKIPSFVVTLGMLEIARGMTYELTRSESRFIGSAIEWLGEPIPNAFVSPAFLMALGLVGVFQWLLHFTVLGRMSIAIGTNAETVRMSGIRVFPYSFSIFSICGALCGLAGIVQTSRLSTVDPNAGVGIELSAIAACVIGGTSLRGGAGSIVSTLYGVLIVQVLQTGLAQIGVQDPMKRIITGSVIVLAVLIDSLRTGRSAR